MFQDLIASQFGWVGNLYSTFQAYKKNAELKNEPDPIMVSGLKCGALAILGGSLFLASKHDQKKEASKLQLIDEADAIYTDNFILEQLCALQTYRDLQTILFQEIVESCDRLIFLEKGMIRKTIAPRPSDRVTAFDYYRRCYNALTKFQLLIKQDLGAEHAVCAHVIIRKIESQLAIYYGNIVKMTSDFKMENTLKRAPGDVAKVAKKIAFEQNEIWKREKESELQNSEVLV